MSTRMISAALMLILAASVPGCSIPPVSVSAADMDRPVLLGAVRTIGDTKKDLLPARISFEIKTEKERASYGAASLYSFGDKANAEIARIAEASEDMIFISEVRVGSSCFLLIAPDSLYWVKGQVNVMGGLYPGEVQGHATP